MCDSRRTPATTPRPRWGRLYAVLPLALAGFSLAELSVPARVMRVALEFGIAGAAWMAIAWWVRANRVALDQLEWCACAPETVRVRVIASRPQRPSLPAPIAAVTSRAAARAADETEDVLATGPR